MRARASTLFFVLFSFNRFNTVTLLDTSHHLAFNTSPPTAVHMNHIPLTLGNGSRFFPTGHCISGHAFSRVHD